MSYYKVSNSYDKPNKRVVWLFLKENALVSINRELYPNTSMAVDSLSIDPFLTSEYTNPLNRGALETSTALYLSFQFPLLAKLL